MQHFQTKCLSLVLTTVMLAIPATAALAAQPFSGKEIYERDCALCHGADGLADTPVGLLLQPRPRRFADPVEMARLSDDQIYHAIKDGKPGTAMASWSKVLSEPEIGNVMDYIHQFAGRCEPMDEQQLSLAVGHRIYQKECAFCHGPTGHADTDAARVLKPPPRNFADPIEMARVDDGRMYAAIKLGVPGTAMASWANLMTPAEIIDVMRYVRSLQEPLPDVVTPELLDVEVGGNIYKQYCVTCHGTKGDANTPIGQVLVPRPRNFTDPQGMANLSDQQMAATISQGKPGTAMAAWGGILNTQDIERVIRYIRTDFSPKH